MRRLILMTALAAGAAHAHPDHPTGLMSLVHLLTEPDHLAMLLLPVVIAGAIWFRRRSRKADALRVKLPK